MFEFTVTASSPAAPAQLVHGPDNDDAHSTLATVPGCKLVQTKTPFRLKEVMTGNWAAAW